MPTQRAKKSSRSTQCFCQTISAVLKNLRAKASSRKPKVTLTVLSHPPDLGRPLSQPGKAANKIKGSDRAKLNPNMPTAGPRSSPLTAVATKSWPISGPVQLKLTRARVNAIKKIPRIPLRWDWSSALLTQDEGSVISNRPKKLRAKTTKSTKKARLNQGLVAMAFKASEPKVTVTRSPRTT